MAGQSIGPQGVLRRVYAIGNVNASYMVGGLSGFSSGLVEYGFATGSVAALQNWDDVSHAVAVGGLGTISELYYDLNSVCTENGTPCDIIFGTGIDLTATPNYFYVKSNPPLSFWDFDSV